MHKYKIVSFHHLDARLYFVVIQLIYFMLYYNNATYK